MLKGSVKINIFMLPFLAMEKSKPHFKIWMPILFVLLASTVSYAVYSGIRNSSANKNSNGTNNGSTAQTVTLRYDLTQCSDPWYNYTGKNGEKPTEVTSTISLFLKEQRDITLKSIEKKGSGGGIFCEACTCPNGFYVVITADKKYESQLKNVGFKAETSSSSSFVISSRP